MYNRKYESDKIMDGLRCLVEEGCSSDSKEETREGKEIQKEARWRKETDGAAEGF